MFHPKAWRDKAIMKKWIGKNWYNIFHNPSTSGSSGKILHADVRWAQQKPNVKQWLQKCKTTLINVPVQPLVVSINKPFKDHLGGTLRTTFRHKSGVVHRGKNHGWRKTCFYYEMICRSMRLHEETIGCY